MLKCDLTTQFSFFHLPVEILRSIDPDISRCKLTAEKRLRCEIGFKAALSKCCQNILRSFMHGKSMETLLPGKGSPPIEVLQFLSTPIEQATMRPANQYFHYRQYHVEPHGHLGLYGYVAKRDGI